MHKDLPENSLLELVEVDIEVKQVLEVFIIKVHLSMMVQGLIQCLDLEALESIMALLEVLMELEKLIHCTKMLQQVESQANKKSYM
jgi:hypothetical protein